MTVRRERQIEIAAPPVQTAGWVRRALAAQSGEFSYKILNDALESGGSEARIIPRWYPLLASTGFSVALRPGAAGTLVTAATRSQFFVIGDIFGFYNRYLDVFFASLEAQRRLG
ncbi:MAG TPA: hypothetical protein VGE07_02590 [Herpetosiphonaceae bacterium]